MRTTWSMPPPANRRIVTAPMRYSPADSSITSGMPIATASPAAASPAIGIVPLKVMPCSDMTRPRKFGGVDSCSIA